MLGLIMIFAAESAVSEHAMARRKPADHRPARYFVSGERNAHLLSLIERNSERKIGFAGHFSISYVACGTACGSYYLIDRRNGAVIVVPDEINSGMMVGEVHATPGSDALEVTIEPSDGVGSRCFVRHLRLAGTRLISTRKATPITCPH